MPGQDNGQFNNICVGLLAHVDAGKTTLSESILYDTGVIRNAGRVDHQDSFFDSDSKERARGITIFSKQALFSHRGKNFTLIDTPGHVDFSAEMERTLSVLDIAVLIISAPEGVSGHDITLWRLLRSYDVPVFVFINKTDRDGTDPVTVTRELIQRLGEGFVYFGADADVFYEDAAALSEEAMEEYFESGTLSDETVAGLIAERKLFICAAGSALKNEGVTELLDIISRFTRYKAYPQEFGAIVYKITRDQKGKRLAHIKLTGGSLRPKDKTGTPGDYGRIEEIYSVNGTALTPVKEVYAGMTAAVTGLKEVNAGDTIGKNRPPHIKLIEPLFFAGIEADPDMDRHVLYMKLKELEEEVPEIDLSFDEIHGTINAGIMGEVQTDVLKAMAKERFGIDISFSAPKVHYKETVTGSFIGAGHYEPLRHYAEAHILIEPGERGSGIEISSAIGSDQLRINFIKLILTHLAEKKHKGTLIGAELTDARLTLISGRSHEKHTEGGDFREAAYRAVRQGLMKAREAGCVKLLEPYYEIEMTVPAANVGRAMNDLSRMCKSFDGPLEAAAGEAMFTGRAPASVMNGYSAELSSYTGGFGRLELRFCGYDECAVLPDEINIYDPESDLDDPSGSVFCAHGAGYYVPWYEADDLMHIDVHEEHRLYIERKKTGDRIPAAEKHPYGDGTITDMEISAGMGVPGNAGGKNADGSRYGCPAVQDHSGRGADRDVRSGSGGKSGEKTDYLGAGLASDKELEAIFKATLARNTNASKAAYKRDSVRRAEGGTRGNDGKIIRIKGNADADDSREAPGGGNARAGGGNARAGGGNARAGGSKSRAGGSNADARGGRAMGNNGNADTGGRSQDFRDRPYGKSGKSTADISLPRKKYLLIDGYNIIFAWDELNTMAAINIDSSRTMLIDIMSNYQSFTGVTLIIVFDAYKREGSEGSVEKHGNVYVVYTREAQTADSYIEKAVHELGRERDITVATNDRMEQTIVFGAGSMRMTAKELHDRVRECSIEIEAIISKHGRKLENRMKLTLPDADGT